MINLPFDLSIDYFAVLGVHYGASTDQVKKAYRKMARRYHPDVSKIRDAKEKFQEISEAYEILRKYREDYCRQYSRKLEEKRTQSRYQQARSAQAASTSPNRSAREAKNHTRAKDPKWQDQRKHDKQQDYGFQSDSRAKSDKNQHSEHSKQQEFQWEFQSRYEGVHRPIHGKDRIIEYPLTLRYAIRQLRIGRFYVPGLKVSMKFTRQAFEGKTFRIAGKGYRGLFGGRDGDFLVRFQIRLDEERFELKDGDLYAKYFVAPSLLHPGRTIMLDTPGGRVDLVLPENFAKQEYFKVPKMGLPEDEFHRPGDLFVKILPRETEKTKPQQKTQSSSTSKQTRGFEVKNSQ
nr:DnaJ domain-containing protein [Thiomicrorhabdus indica]